jgi:5'-nucleotidase / UDP-sugar diphosphatase
MAKKIFLYIALFISLYAQTYAQQVYTKKLIILHTNDLHSRLNGFSPEMDYTPLSTNDDNTVGGFARIASLIDEEKKTDGNEVLVLDAGDFLMGTLFPFLEKSTGFQLELMKKMGYDVVTLGNHEFDFGPEALAGILSKSYTNGPTPLIVASNLSFSEKEKEDDALKTLFDQNILKPYLVIERNGLKIGIFGILGYNAIHDAPLARPVHFEDPVKSAQKFAHILKETEKVDLVICLSHSGVNKDENGDWCGEDVELAKKVPEIDVIISGHTHTLINDQLVVNGIPIVQTGSYGMGLGKLELEVDKGKIIHSDSKVIPINDSIQGNPAIQQLLTEQEKLISEHLLNFLKLDYSSVVAETSFPLVCNEDTLLEKSNLGPLIADAIYTYVNKENARGVDVTFFASGLIRDNIIPGKSGKQTVADLFRVVSLGSGKDDVPGYPLARIYVTGKELKGIMEILYMAPSGNKDNYIYFGGLRASFDPGKGLLRKITSIETGDPGKGFTKVDWSRKNKKLYSISADIYLLQFIGIIKKLSHGLVRVTLKDENGVPIKSVNDALIDGNAEVPGIQEMKEWVALVWFLSQQPDKNGNGIPEIPEFYRTGNPRLFKK